MTFERLKASKAKHEVKLEQERQEAEKRREAERQESYAAGYQWAKDAAEWEQLDRLAKEPDFGDHLLNSMLGLPQHHLQPCHSKMVPKNKRAFVKGAVAFFKEYQQAEANGVL